MASEQTPSPKEIATHLVYWRDPKHSGAAFSVGLFYFFAVGVQGWSSLGFLAASLALILLVRFCYFQGSKALASAKLIQPRPPPVVPTEWLSEAEVQQHIATITAALNAFVCGAIKLSYGEDAALLARVVGALLALAYACRLLGTTGLFFLLFVLGFSLPRAYEQRQPEVDAAVAQAMSKAEELKRQGQEKVKLAMEYVRIPSAHDLDKQGKQGEEEKKKL